MSYRTIALLLALAFALPCLLADPPPLSPAPSLGPDKYTIHTSGTLRDIITALTTLTHRQIWRDTGLGRGAPPPPAAKGIDDTPVSLNFDNATLADILMSLCAQAGLIYEVPAGFYGPQGPPIQLRPGDPKVDGRPTCVLDGYTLRVTRVTIAQSRDAEFHWGTASPSRPDPSNQFGITIDITPHSDAAARLYAGIRAGVRAVPNVGTPLEPDRRMGPSYVYGVQRGPWDTGILQPVQLSLPLPDPAATILTRLEGELVRFSEVKVTELKIPADGGAGPAGSPEGKTFTKDDVRATVTVWRRQGTDLQVTIEAEAPPLPHKDDMAWYPRDWQTGALIGADGRRAAMPSSGSSGNGKIQMGLQFSLQPMGPTPEGAAQPAPIVPAALLLTFYRTGSADKILPFVIENIALP